MGFPYNDVLHHLHDQQKNTNKGFCVTESQRPAHKNIKIVTFKKLRVKIDRYYILTRYIISHNEE